MRLAKILMLFSVLSFFSFTSRPDNHPGPWIFIADKSVSWGADHDVINLGNVNDDFRFLKLKVTDGPLKMYDMKVTFDNGEVQDVTIRALIRQGGESRVIDLNGDLRHLTKIEFWYETKGFLHGKARMAVWGRK